MKQLLFVLMLTGFSALAQQPVYQPFDVDSAAQPRGGMAYLNTFLQANLRKPVTAQSKGIGGRVIVSGIVGTNGHVSDVTVTQSKSPEFNREAVRVFSLFNAWQPAQKAGKVVRQQVSIPVMFKPNTPFAYVDGAQVSYFDTDNKPVAEDSEGRRYKQITPLDTNGIPTGDIVVYKTKGTGWKEEYRIPLVRKLISPRSAPGRSVYQIGYQSADEQWRGDVFSVDDAGTLLNQDHYENGQRRGLQMSYHANGLVMEQVDISDTKQSATSWHYNGQMGQIDFSDGTSRKIMALWDTTGRQLVRDGNGQVVSTNRLPSSSDGTQWKTYVEKGQYANGAKQGVWTGRYADGSFFYEEQYEKGVFRGGKSLGIMGDTVRYAQGGQMPEFNSGGLSLGEFLGKNLQYPAAAQRAGIQGKVLISFMVCTDGTLCDYEVLQSVAPSLDREALRVVKAMSGHWKPGTQRGQNVPVKFVMPISFSLQVPKPRTSGYDIR